VPDVELVTVPVPADAAAALVMPDGRPPDPAPSVAAAFKLMFGNIAADPPDVISVHAFDAPAFALAADLPALCTLHLPPIVPAVVDAVKNLPSRNLVTVSRSCLRDWQAAGVQVEQVIHNGVVPIEVGGWQVDNVALVAGRISPEKGIDHALRAARAAGLQCRVAGARYDPSYAVDLQDAEELGPLPQVELRRVMGHSAVTVCAVRWEEPFGMVAAEAQMAGCPVAGYRRGALPEVVEDGVSGVLADPDDVESLTQAIAQCRSLDRTAVRLSAERRLHVETMLDAYERALSAIAS
jgi:glycosyltransferase involved in cell wall biosynthesis